MPKNFVFTITPGRSGSTFLHRLFKDNLLNASVYQERTGFGTFGENTPDCSHLNLFNSVGNVAKVRQFWSRKFSHDLAGLNEHHVETSHILSKAGLVENLDFLTDKDCAVRVLILKRDIFKIVWSLYNRYEFFNLGHTWLFWLDPRYPNTIVNSEAFVELGPAGMALWYVYEMYTRAEYYKILYSGYQRISFYEVDLVDLVKHEVALNLCAGMGLEIDEFNIPDKINASRKFPFEGQQDYVRSIVNKYNFDPHALARSFIESGNRLAR